MLSPSVDEHGQHLRMGKTSKSSVSSIKKNLGKLRDEQRSTHNATAVTIGLSTESQHYSGMPAAGWKLTFSVSPHSVNDENVA